MGDGSGERAMNSRKDAARGVVQCGRPSRRRRRWGDGEVFPFYVVAIMDDNALF